jgi:hypothetical protein
MHRLPNFKLDTSFTQQSITAMHQRAKLDRQMMHILLNKDFRYVGHIHDSLLFELMKEARA